MYRPPQNTNRVKSIKSKFENIESNENKSPENNKLRQNGYRNNLNNTVAQPEPKYEKSSLQRQISDPCKRNIKRTPAFRVDKSLERTSEFQRNSFDRSTLFETKVKQFSAVKNSCDTNSNIVVNSVPKKPVLLKSKSSLDFEYIRSKFDKKSNLDDTNKNVDNTKNDVDLSLLYTEPIPKSLRNKNINTCVQTTVTKTENIYNASTLKVSDKPKNPVQSDGLTDTLKAALKKPLPTGPAPKKPPRTFEHSAVEKIEKNISFLHISKLIESKLSEKVTSPTKKDPKYMLSKLENAVRNKKLRVRKQPKTDVSTSGEDSDDSLLFRSKTSKTDIRSENRTLPRLPSRSENYTSSTFNLNCLNSFSCSVANYEKIKEPNSCFFLDSLEEPVYSEPFHYLKDSGLVLRNMEGSTRSKGTEKSARNSLYYMSTPVVNGGSRCDLDTNEPTNEQDDVKHPELHLSENFMRPSAENSSLSSFTSDLDSTPSPMEEGATVQSILQCFETKLVQDNNNPCHIMNSTNRVENLKNCLRSTLDRSFGEVSGGGAVRDSDSENNDEKKLWDIIRKFETYRQTMPKYCKPKIHKDTLFFCCLIMDKFKDVVQIKYKYPSCVDIPQNLESLCFPEDDTTLLYSSDTAQSYSLLITNDKGDRMFGYCRRVKPEGCTRSLPLAYCILSKYRAPRFYKKVLEELETRHGIPNKYRDELICQFYHQKFPKPGDSIFINLTNIEPLISKTDSLEESVDLYNYVNVNKTGDLVNNNTKAEHVFVNERDIKSSSTAPSYIVETDAKRELVLTLHPDTRYEDADLRLLHHLPDDILLKIFSSLLLERKVVLISSSIGKLSSCVDSLQSILYPFTWYHTLIPILPQQLWDIVESPTPVICGVLSKEVVEEYQIENGIVVDLDTHTVRKEEGDENKIISASMQKVWRRNIALANKTAVSKEYVHSVFLYDAYLQVFILCFKDYKRHFVDGVFMKEEFLKKKTKGVKRFLKMFTETYMFQAFLDTVLTNPENLTEFDRKIEMYGSDESNVILDKLLDWHR